MRISDPLQIKNLIILKHSKTTMQIFPKTRIKDVLNRFKYAQRKITTLLLNQAIYMQVSLITQTTVYHKSSALTNFSRKLSKLASKNGINSTFRLICNYRLKHPNIILISNQTMPFIIKHCFQANSNNSNREICGKGQKPFL